MHSPVRRLVRGVLAACAVVVLFVLVWTVGTLLLVRGAAVDASRELEAARTAGSSEQAVQHLRAAQDRFARVVGGTGQLGPALISRLPLLGRTIVAVDVTARAGEQVTASLASVLEEMRQRPPLQPGGRIDGAAASALEQQLRAAATSTSGPVARLEQVSTSLVPGIVSGKVVQAQSQLAGLPVALARGADALAGVRTLSGADGPRRILLAVQNNAELRATGGLVSVFAEVTADAGHFTIGPFRDVEQVADPPERARRVPSPPDYHALFGPYLADTTLWKNTNMDPDVPTSSAVLAEVAAATTGQRPDVVVWLDVRALGAVLSGAGPVTLQDGTKLDAGNAVEVLLSGSYTGVDDQAARRARLREAADIVAARLLGDRPNLTQIAPSLAAAGAGGHLAVWSSRPAEQQLWQAAGAAAPVAAGGGDLAAMTVHNLGGGQREGNKLDFYARRQVEVRAVVGRDAVAVVQRFTLHNQAPASGLPPYVAGLAAPGTSNNLVLFALPSGARAEQLRRGDGVVPSAPQPLGDHAVVQDVVSLAPGTSVTWELRYSLPLRGGTYRLQVVPQPLAFDATLRLSVTAAGGVRLRPAGGDLRQDLVWTGPLDHAVRVDVRAQPAVWWRRALDAVARFWSEPVRLP